MKPLNAPIADKSQKMPILALRHLMHHEKCPSTEQIELKGVIDQSAEEEASKNPEKSPVKIIELIDQNRIKMAKIVNEAQKNYHQILYLSLLNLAESLATAHAQYNAPEKTRDLITWLMKTKNRGENLTIGNILKQLSEQNFNPSNPGVMTIKEELQKLTPSSDANFLDIAMLHLAGTIDLDDNNSPEDSIILYELKVVLAIIQQANYEAQEVIRIINK